MATDGWPVDSIKQVVVAPGDPDRLLVLTPQQGVFALPLDREANKRTAGIEADFRRSPTAWREASGSR
jgi:hypothetical protein